MNIEDYIQKNRNQLDTQKPDKDRLWQGIYQKQQQMKTRKMHTIRWVAASIVILLVTGMFLRQELTMQRQIDNLSAINAKLAQKERKYQKAVDQKWNQFESLPAHSSPVESMLIEELQELDTIYKQGLTEIKNNPDNDRAVMILLETYEKRLRIIEKLIYERHKQIRYEKRNKNIEL